MLLKLRQDYKQQQGKAFSLRTFHDTLLGNGTAPFWLHRQLMLGDDARRRARIGTAMPLYEYQCDACGHRFEKIQKFSDPLDRDLPEVRRHRPQADVVAGVSVQGQRLVHHRLRARRITTGATKADSASRARRRRRARARRSRRSRRSRKESERAKESKERRRPTSPSRRRNPSKSTSSSSTKSDQSRATRRHEAGLSRRRVAVRLVAQIEPSTASRPAPARSSDARYAENLSARSGRRSAK